MTEHSTAQTDSNALIATMHDLRVGIMILDVNHNVLQVNPTASKCFGSVVSQDVHLSDNWLRQQNIRIKDLDSQPTSVSTLFTDFSIPLGIETAQETQWLSVQCDNTHWQGQSVIILLFSDINALIEDYIRLKKQSKNADVCDSITGLHNRRHALERMQQMHNHGKRYGGEFAIALIDIDHFKRINDTYGQTYGDDVIAKIALTLKNALRETDFCARFGGEEFLVLMPETSMIDAVITLDRLRQQISELKWENRQAPITVSAGVHLWQRNRSIEQLLFETDQRLTMAKSAGRNQVCGDLN